MTKRSGPAAEVASDWRFLMMLGTGLLMQVSHPVIGGGVGAHSTYRSDPYGRFNRSVWPVLAMVIMGDEAAAFSADLRAMHRNIQGVDHVGRRYHAWDPEAAFLVPATACYASEQMAALFGTPLDAAQREEVYAGWRQAALDFGIPERHVPADHAAYRDWLDHVVEHRLEDHPTAHDVLSTLRRPAAPPYVPTWLWRPFGHGVVGRIALLVTLGTIPPALRDRLGLAWTARNQRSLERFGRVVRIVNRLVPKPLRTPTRAIVRRRWPSIRAYAAHGAELGIAPSIAASAPVVDRAAG